MVSAQALTLVHASAGRQPAITWYVGGFRQNSEKRLYASRIPDAATTELDGWIEVLQRNPSRLAQTVASARE